MKQYNIYEYPHNRFEAVKNGWSWPAFIFGFIWTMAKRMWWLSAAVMLGLVAIGGFTGVFLDCENDPTFCRVLDLVGLVLGVIFGFYGNKWREKNLQSRGFDYRETVSAKNPQSAIASYLKREVAQEIPI